MSDPPARRRRGRPRKVALAPIAGDDAEAAGAGAASGLRSPHAAAHGNGARSRSEEKTKAVAPPGRARKASPLAETRAPQTRAEKRTRRPPPVRGRIVGKGEMAQILGVSSRMVDRHVSEGCPIRSRGGRFAGWELDTAAVIGWLIDRERRGGPAVNEGAAAAMDARRRKALADAQFREYELAERRGETVLVSQVRPIIENELANVRSRLRAIPSRVAPELVHLADVREIEALLETEVRETLDELTADRVEFSEHRDIAERH